MTDTSATTPVLRLDAVESADICGRKTRIRPMAANELARVYGWINDPDVQPFWDGSDHHRSLDEYVAHWEPHYFNGSQPDRGRCFTIETDDRPIGMIVYNRVDTLSRSTEIDIVIGEPGCRDRGYGTDALRAFLAFLFDTVGLHRVWLATYDYNARARRAYDKLGFVQEGVTRQSDCVDGRWVDSVIYGILKHELRREEGDA